MLSLSCAQEQLSPVKEAQILDGAALVFALDGYEGASMSRIAAEAGVSKGTLYNYFDGKAELFAAYITRGCTDGIALAMDDLDLALPLEESLRRVCRRVLEIMLSETGLIIYRMVVAEAPKFPELAEAFFEAGPGRAQRSMTTWIERTVEAGLLRVSDPSFAAEQLFALIQTQLCIKRRLRLIKQPNDEEIEHVVVRAVHLFLHGCAG